jgi:hypothetical protein
VLIGDFLPVETVNLPGVEKEIVDDSNGWSPPETFEVHLTTKDEVASEWHSEEPVVDG